VTLSEQAYDAAGRASGRISFPPLSFPADNVTQDPLRFGVSPTCGLEDTMFTPTRRFGFHLGFIFLFLASLPQVSFAKDHLTIDSIPAGATVEIDGIAVGKTPYSVEVPGGYIHGTRSVFGKVLRQQMHVRLQLDGYLPLDSDLARGPMPWIALNGVYHGDYWLLKTANFSFKLNKAASAFTGNVQVASANEALSLRPAPSSEDIVRMASPAVLFLRGSDGTGSGFLVTATGVAVTNAHVAKGQSVLAASTANGQTFNATVQYIDPDLDLALLKLEGTNFAYLSVADLSTIQAGSSVLAIGTPSRGFQNTVTKGIASAIGPMSSEPGTWVQTDAAVNPGNSGGPLLNSSGEVVGITTQKQFVSSDGRPLQGISFALSSQDLLSVLRRFYPNTENQHQSPSNSHSGTGSVLVSSDAEGADIFVDEKFVGNTPSTLTLPAGPHNVRVEAQNRVSWARQIDLLKDSNVNLKATLMGSSPTPPTLMTSSAGTNLGQSASSSAPVLVAAQTTTDPLAQPQQMKRTQLNTTDTPNLAHFSKQILPRPFPKRKSQNQTGRSER
jgi:S1-C subfamily serine protease